MEVRVKSVSFSEENFSSRGELSKRICSSFENSSRARNLYHELYSNEPQQDLEKILEGELSGAIQFQKSHYWIEAAYTEPLSRLLSSLPPIEIYQIGGIDLVKWQFLFSDMPHENLLDYMEGDGFERKALVNSKDESHKYESSTALLDSIYSVVVRHSDFAPITGGLRDICLSHLKPKVKPDAFEIWPLSVYNDSLMRLHNMANGDTSKDRYTPMTMDAPFGLVLCWKNTPQALVSFRVSTPKLIHIEQLQGLKTVRWPTEKSSSRGLAKFEDPFEAMLNLVIAHASEMGFDRLSIIQNPPVSIRRDDYGRPLFSDEQFKERYVELPKRLGFEDDESGLIFKLSGI